MPTMYEIYDKFAAQYHELVVAEDCEGNLPGALQELTDWNQINVIEAGAGTGRITRHYVEQVNSAVCFDRSSHMLGFAQKLLHQFDSKITYITADNLCLPQLEGDFDLFIEGWSFGHVVCDCKTLAAVKGVTEQLLKNSSVNLGAGGQIILIESMGTNVDVPAAPNEQLELFYHELENVHGFTLKLIRTDYEFESNSEAQRILGFFFGEEEVAEIKKRKTGRIPEWTGIWHR